MKVLQINSVCGVGSTGRIATDLYKVLENQGHECKIAYGRGNAPDGIDSIKIGSNLDNYTHVLKTRVFDKHGFGSVNATKKFIEEVKAYDPDIIHLHNIHGYYINIEILFNYLKEANKPVVWTLHDCWPFTGHCSHFDYIGCDKWKNGCFDCIQKNNYPKSIIRDNSKNNYEEKNKFFTLIDNLTIITPSNWLANLVRESFLSKYEIKVIPNGIDLDLFRPTESNFRERFNLEFKCILLGVSNVWNENKGINTFIELSKHLCSNYQIVLVGLDKKQIRFLPKNIIAINKTNNIKELAKIYTEADIFINPSVQETMGLATVEALACGTPCIVNDTTAIPEVIDEKCGIKVERGNIEEIIRSIEEIYNSNMITKKDCIRKANNYNKISKFREYIDLYNFKINNNL